MAVVKSRMNVEAPVNVNAQDNVALSLHNLLLFIFCCHRAKATAFYNLNSALSPIPPT